MIYLKEMGKICFLFIILLFTCCNKKKEDTRFKEFPKTIEIKGESIGTSQKFKSLSMTGIVDSILILNVNMNDYVFYLFNTNDFRFLTKTGKTGRGPHELSGVDGRSTSLNKAKGLIYISDPAKGKIFSFSIDSALNNKNYQPRVYLDKPEKLAIIHAIEIVNDSLLLAGHIIGHNLALINKQGKVMEYIGKLPEKPEDVRAVHYRNLYNSYFTYSPQNKQIALVFNKQDKLLSYNLKGEKLFQRIGPDFIEVNYNNQYESSKKEAYWDLESDSQHIYGLYSGKKSHTMPADATKLTDRQRFYPKTIHIFDWRGNPILKVKLEKQATDFVIDRETNRLITLSQSEKPFTVYDLSLIQNQL